MTPALILLLAVSVAALEPCDSYQPCPSAWRCSIAPSADSGRCVPALQPAALGEQCGDVLYNTPCETGFSCDSTSSRCVRHTHLQRLVGLGSVCGGFAGVQCRRGLACHSFSGVSDTQGICHDAKAGTLGEGAGFGAVCSSAVLCGQGLVCRVPEPYKMGVCMYRVE